MLSVCHPVIQLDPHYQGHSAAGEFPALPESDLGYHEGFPVLQISGMHAGRAMESQYNQAESV